MQYLGIDGCRGGWLFSVLTAESHLKVLLYSFLEDGMEELLNAEAVSIDMPMGLVSRKDEERTCDALIRKELGHPFSSSVFNVPCRQAVYTTLYPEANRLNRIICGKGLSVQSWNIVPKIRELDRLLDDYPALKHTLHEGHPELCFKKIRGYSLSHKKKTDEGKDERLKLLNVLSPNTQNNFLKFRNLYLKKAVADDDILDSMVLAYNAKKIATGKYKKFPTHEVLDKNGVRMEVRQFIV